MNLFVLSDKKNDSSWKYDLVSYVIQSQLQTTTTIEVCIGMKDNYNFKKGTYKSCNSNANKPKEEQVVVEVVFCATDKDYISNRYRANIHAYLHAT